MRFDLKNFIGLKNHVMPSFELGEQYHAELRGTDSFNMQSYNYSRKETSIVSPACILMPNVNLK